MDFNTKVAIATYVTFFGLVIVSVVLIVVLTRSDDNIPVAPSTSPNPKTSPIPQQLGYARLKSSTGQCYQFKNLAPKMTVGNCDNSYWIINNTTANPSVTFDGQTFETCIQTPVKAGSFVYGTVGTGCVPVSLTNNTIKSGNLCINITGTDLTWGPCSTAYTFAIETINI
jgi:hypothetical protein